MFFATKSAAKQTEEFIARQRAKEIAAKGRSRIPASKTKKERSRSMTQSMRQLIMVPTTGSGSTTETDSNMSSEFFLTDEDVKSFRRTSGYLARQHELKEEAIGKIEEAQRGQALKLDKIEANILHHAGMAEARLEYSENYIGACLSMNVVKGLQQDFIQVCRRIDGLEVLKENVTLGYVKPRHVPRDMEEILTSEQQQQQREKHSYEAEELLQELARQQFVPLRPKVLQGL